MTTGGHPTGPAAQRFAVLSPLRDPFLLRGRECAKLTIPALLPPLGFNATTRLPTPWQSMGARGVNNLDAKMLLTLFPPNTPCFRLAVDDFQLEQLTHQTGMRALVEKALNKVERAVVSEIEGSAMRPGLGEALKQLIVTGNVLIYVKREGGIRVYRLDQYVCKRDPSGNLLEIVTHERISPLEVPASIRDAVLAEVKPEDRQKASGDNTLDLYTHIQRTEAGWKISQEVCGHEIPGSQGTYPEGKSPWLALRFITIDGEDYGRGYVEEYLGDLRSLEALQKAIVQGAAAAAKVLFLVKPNGSTKPKVLTESESGDVRIGNKDDVTVLQMDKYADFKVALELRNDLVRTLSFAFLLNSAVQRNAERVTADEIRYMAQELEASLGGIYSTMSVELQLPFITVVMHNLTVRGRLPALPGDSIRPVVTTGVDAIGRGNDLTKLTTLFTTVRDALGEQVAQTYIKSEDAIERLGAALGIDTDGLIRTEEEVTQQQQQQGAYNLVDRAAPEMVKAAAAQQTPAQ
jgi:hypothetical protein